MFAISMAIAIVVPFILTVFFEKRGIFTQPEGTIEEDTPMIGDF